MANYCNRVDNSESSRNGDYIPTRFSAQSEAISLIFNAKTSSNPESAVGLMNMGGAGPEVLVTPDTDIGRILAGLHQTKIKGSIHISTAISVAMLALKHRQNKAQKQRIIVFVCSELRSSADKGDNEKELVRLAKKCKKNNVSVDFVAFGDAVEGGTKSVLEKFVEAAGGSSGEHGSYLAVVPPGPGLLSDAIITTPIVNAGGTGEGAGPDGFGDVNGAGGPGAGGFEYGVDPNTDPDLAMALRMSMEEEQNRLERERRAREEAERSRMEGIPEEGQPQTNGDASTAENASKQPRVEDDKNEPGEGGSGDRMDTA